MNEEKVFHTLQAYGPEMEECIQSAVGLARVTGSTGASYSIDRDGQTLSFARVERAREEIVHVNATVNKEG